MSLLSRRTPAALLTAALLVAAPAVAVAQPVLFDNGTPDNQNGYQVATPYSMANDFTLASASQLGGFQWYVLRSGVGGPGSISSDFTWRIFGDALGAPGSLLHSGNVVGATGTKTAFACCGSSLSFEAYMYDVNLGGLTLGAGSYWLAIGNVATAGSTTTYWATSNASGNQMYEYSSSPGQWNGTGGEGAFRVTGVADMTATPEPASLALLGTGLVGLGAFARRRARRTS